MKRTIIAVIAGLMLLSAVPAFAAPNENASPTAFQAQAINICRQMMGDAVNSGDMTKDQLKACIDMMKVSPCTDMMQQ